MVPLVVFVIHERALSVVRVKGQASAGHEQAVAHVVDMIGVVAPRTETAQGTACGLIYFALGVERIGHKTLFAKRCPQFALLGHFQAGESHVARIVAGEFKRIGGIEGMNQCAAAHEGLTGVGCAELVAVGCDK